MTIFQILCLTLYREVKTASPGSTKRRLFQPAENESRTSASSGGVKH